ncbi:hypothetical protein [Halorarius halobius]|uniref:hypothetical protein n=1 Tax=Halorarius halobius TaxID=2962671 RepID=UPI0020CD40C5|nr:hypothetical protein [Halorarius halobius]
MGDLQRWAFAAFHTALLVAVGVWVAHLTAGLGDPLAGLNTLLGLALYAVLWAVLYLATGRAFAAAPPGDSGLRALLVAGAGYGAATGVALLAGLVVVGAVVAVVTLGGSLTILLVGLFGTVVGAVVGAVLGVVFALLDAALVRLGARVVPSGA